MQSFVVEFRLESARFGNGALVRPPGLPVGKPVSGILDAAVWPKHSTLTKSASNTLLSFAGHFTF